METAFVKIWGQTAGAVSWDAARQLAYFEYDSAFLNRGWDLAPLKMPLRQGTQVHGFPELRPPKDHTLDTFKGLPGLLADSLPDNYGNQLINIWLAQQGRAPEAMNPVEKLCFIGIRGVGALEFEPALPKTQKTSFDVDVDSLVQISREMLQKRERFSTDLNDEKSKAVTDMLKIGTSAGGARPKAVIAYNEKTGQIRSGQANAPKGYEHWLLKLDGVSDVQLGDTQGYGRVEMAYHLMAKDCGVEMMECRLLEENGRAHFMTKRFDRSGGSTKHHMQTWCAMEHFDFNVIGSFSYEQLFTTMRALGLHYQEAEQLFRRMVFNVLAKNCDDHTKNFAFILKKDGPWQLAPAYDLCYAYRPDSYWVSQHTLSLNGKRKDHTLADFLTLAHSIGLKKPEPIIVEIQGVVSQWKSYAKTAGVDSQKTTVIANNLVKLP